MFFGAKVVKHPEDKQNTNKYKIQPQNNVCLHISAGAAVAHKSKWDFFCHKLLLYEYYVVLSFITTNFIPDGWREKKKTTAQSNEKETSPNEQNRSKYLPNKKKHSNFATNHSLTQTLCYALSASH